MKTIYISQCEHHTFDKGHEHPGAAKLRVIRGTQLQTEIKLTDRQSGIRHYKVAVGTMSGANQLLPYNNIGQRSVYKPKNIKIRHGMQVMVSVVALNNAGSRAAASSELVIVEWTPPLISKPTVTVERFDNNEYVQLYTVSWNGTNDPETNVSSCGWSIIKLN